MIWIPLALVARGVILGVDLVRSPTHLWDIGFDLLVILFLLLAEVCTQRAAKEAA